MPKYHVEEDEEIGAHMKLTLAVKWKVKVEGKVRSIQLFDVAGNKLEGSKARWEGNFDCSSNKLTSLEGAPASVGGSFNCSSNKLTSLKGAPALVGGGFYCGSNKLTSLKGAPASVGGDFYCGFNNLTSLKGAPASVGGSFECSCNKLTRLKGAPASVGGSFDCSSNELTSLKGAPASVGGSFYCSYNELTNLKGAPASVGGGFNCNINKLTSLKGAPAEYSDMFPVFLKHGYIFADRILTKLVSKRTVGEATVYKTTKLCNGEVIYVAKLGAKFSHGDTVKQAIADLRYKLADRDTSKYQSWKLQDTKTSDELIEAYMAITGACSTGTKMFCESKALPVKLTVRKAIQLTEGQYGSERFSKFFKK